MGKTLAEGRIYRVSNCCNEIYTGEYRKFYEFVRSHTGGVGGSDNEPCKREIISDVNADKRTITKIEADALERIMDIFIANKKANFRMSLQEIKEMPPRECWILERHLKKELEKLKELQEKYKLRLTTKR